MKNLATAVLFCLSLLTAGASAQEKDRPVKFSSVYTNLNRDCKTIEGRNGTDDASDCRGAGGYRIHIWAAAAAVFLAAETPDKQDRISLATQNFDFDETKIKVEWRLADGKPFAVILRVAKYADPDDQNPYFGKKIGEELVVRGLKGFDEIDFRIDPKTTRDANRIARQAADKAYYMHGKL